MGRHRYKGHLPEGQVEAWCHDTNLKASKHVWHKCKGARTAICHVYAAQFRATHVHLPSIQTCFRFQIGGCSWGVSSGKLKLSGTLWDTSCSCVVTPAHACSYVFIGWPLHSSIWWEIIALVILTKSISIYGTYLSYHNKSPHMAHQ